MKEETYNWIWQKIKNEIDQIDNSLSKQKSIYNFCLTYGSDTKKTIFEEYESIRDELKEKCYENDVRPDGNENLIDHHKISACFCYALIRKKVFSFDFRDDIPSLMLMSNYILAYKVSMMLLYCCLISLYKESDEEYLELKEGISKTDIINNLKNMRQMYFPITSKSHHDYEEGRIRTLAFNDFHGIEFNLLTYSDMVFWIEHHTRQKLEDAVDIKPFDLRLDINDLPIIQESYKE